MTNPLSTLARTTGFVALPPAAAALSDGALLDRLEAALRAESSRVERGPGWAEYRRGGNGRYSPLGAFTTGRVSVAHDGGGRRVRFDLDFRPDVVGVTVLTAAFAAAMAFVAPGYFASGFGYAFVPIAWAWLLVPNALLTRSRVPGFLAKALAGPSA